MRPTKQTRAALLTGISSTRGKYTTPDSMISTMRFSIASMDRKRITVTVIARAARSKLIAMT